MYISVSGAVDSTYATQRFLPVQIFDDGSKICRYLNEKFNAPADLTLASAYTLFKLRCITLSNSTGGRGGDTKPMQKWWLKLKLPIERAKRRKAARERERERGEIRRIWNRHGEKSIPIAMLKYSFRLFIEFFYFQITQRRRLGFDPT